MSYQNSDPAPDSGQMSSAGFGSQSQMGLAEVLQMCCLSRRSGQITFRSGESYGFVYIQHGRVLHAMCGVIEGEEAVYLMLSWPGGGFSLDEGILPHKKTVTLTWEQLLFEGARRADVGMTTPKLAAPATPVTTIEPIANSRLQESQPKLIITRPDQPPIVHELTEEYTHAGRHAGNEIPLPYPSVSSRHCIFILSGSDIVLRDLNSSNGTIVNGESISETILRPGDVIQIGVIQIKFEPGIKRPKLSSPSPVPAPTHEPLPSKISGRIQHNTVKLPNHMNRPAHLDAPVLDDNAFVKGESAISYDSLAKPEAPKPNHWPKIISFIIAALILAAGAYYIIVLHHY